MIEENERAAKFMQAIQRDGEKRRTAIIQAIDEEIAAELEKVKTAAEAKVNCTPFVRQYDILDNKWGALLCQKEYQTNVTRRNSSDW